MLRRFSKDRRGIASIEFALVVPFMLVGTFGTFEVGRYIRAATRLDDAAEMYADIIAQQTSVSSTTMTNFCNGALLTMSPFPTASFQAAVASVVYSTSTSTRSVDWHDESCGTATMMTNAVALATPLTPNAGESAIVVTVTFTYTPRVLFVFKTPLTMSRTAFARPRAGSKVTQS